MSTQRKLTALLHELQHARSPLAQAQVLARAWRTLRELSPTDRRLLARQAGFDGAEDILEGLSRRKGGLAPAMLLRVLGNARGTDASSVTEMLAALRDPERRDEAISLGADFASDLLAEPSSEVQEEEVGAALGELQAVEESIIESPEEALAALNAVEPDPEGELEKPTASESPPAYESEDAPKAENVDETPPKPHPKLPPEPPAPSPPPAVDWSRWQIVEESDKPTPPSESETSPSISDVGSRPFQARAVMGAMGAEHSVFSQLRVLRRELSGFAGSTVATLRELVEAFPDGWARRRALCALLSSGIPADSNDAIELVLSLGHESDRRWCLGLLASRGKLRGAALARALDLVNSPFGKRRLKLLAH